MSRKKICFKIKDVSNDWKDKKVCEDRKGQDSIVSDSASLIGKEEQNGPSTPVWCVPF